MERNVGSLFVELVHQTQASAFPINPNHLDGTPKSWHFFIQDMHGNVVEVMPEQSLWEAGIAHGQIISARAPKLRKVAFCVGTYYGGLVNFVHETTSTTTIGEAFMELVHTSQQTETPIYVEYPSGDSIKWRFFVEDQDQRLHEVFAEETFDSIQQPELFVLLG